MKKEDKFDQYFLKDEFGNIFIEMIRRHLPKTVTTLLEPSCGDGAILYKLPSIRSNIRIIGNDLDSRMTKRCCYRGYKVSNKDFLKHDWSKWGSPKNLAIIGGPPYGTRSKTAIKFFNHAAKYADFIVMVLPASFTRPNIQNLLDPYFHLIDYRELPRNAFHRPDSKKEANIGSVIQVYVRKSEKREPYCPLKTSDFSFVKVSHVLNNPSLATFAVSRRQPVRITTVRDAIKYLKGTAEPTTSGRYIFVHTTNKTVFDTFNKIDWTSKLYFATKAKCMGWDQFMDIYVRYKMKNLS